MALDAWITVILKIVFVIIGGHIAITKVVPLLNDFLDSIIKDSKAVDSFTSLIDIFILVLVGLKIVEFIAEIENQAAQYIMVLEPGFAVVFSLFEYIQWILLGLLLVVAFKRIK